MHGNKYTYIHTSRLYKCIYIYNHGPDGRGDDEGQSGKEEEGEVGDAGDGVEALLAVDEPADEEAGACGFEIRNVEGAGVGLLKDWLLCCWVGGGTHTHISPDGRKPTDGRRQHNTIVC